MSWTRWTMHTELTPLQSPGSRQITQTNGDNGGSGGSDGTRTPHRATSWSYLPPPLSCRTTIRERDWLSRNHASSSFPLRRLFRPFSTYKLDSCHIISNYISTATVNEWVYVGSTERYLAVIDILIFTLIVIAGIDNN